MTAGRGGLVVDSDVCVITVVTDDFFLGGLVTLASFLAYHPESDFPLVVLFEPTRAPLSPDNRERLEALSPRVTCMAADDPVFWAERDRLAAMIGTPDRLAAAFLILEAFRLRGPSRVVALDSDLLIRGACDDLWETEADFGAVRAFDQQGHLPQGFFNSGVITIGPAHLTGTTYRDLMTSTSPNHMDYRVGKADQAVLNAYFHFSRMTYLDPSLNVSKRHYPDRSVPLNEQFSAWPCRILHFVGRKPWHRRRAPDGHYSRVEALWYDALLEHAPDLHTGLVREMDERR